MNLRSASATLLLGGLALLVLAAGGWLLLLGPVTEEVGSTREATTAAVERNQVLDAQLTGLEERAEDLRSTRRAAEELTTLVPATADQAGFFEALGAAAARAGYAPRDVTSLSPTAPVPVAPGVGSAAAPTTPAPETGTEAGSKAGSEAGSEAGTAPPAAPTDYAVQTITLTLTGTYDQAQRLLGELGGLSRALLVRSIALSGEAGSSTLTLTISGQTFVAPPVPEPDDQKAGSGTADEVNASQPG